MTSDKQYPPKEACGRRSLSYREKDVLSAEPPKKSENYKIKK